MCNVCHQYPCHPACPNAPEPKRICRCPACLEPVYKGDRVAEIDGEYYHTECLESMPIEQLLKMLDVELHDADEHLIA